MMGTFLTIYVISVIFSFILISIVRLRKYSNMEEYIGFNLGKKYSWLFPLIPILNTFSVPTAFIILIDSWSPGYKDKTKGGFKVFDVVRINSSDLGVVTCDERSGGLRGVSLLQTDGTWRYVYAVSIRNLKVEGNLLDGYVVSPKMQKLIPKSKNSEILFGE